MEETIRESTDAPHILLTSLGTRVFEGTKYQWRGEEAIADFAPLALMELLDKLNLPKPNRFVALVTAGAKDTTWPDFKTGVHSALGIKPECISIPDGLDSEEIRKILESVAKCIPEGAELTLDVTQGFRHFPFIFYALVLYLKSLRGVNIHGVYYGMAEGIPPADPKPIIDLQPLLELPEWFYAVRMFRDQGTTSPIAALLEPLANMLDIEKTRLFKAQEKEEGKKLATQVNQINTSVKSLKEYAFAYESALPLELGKAGKGLVDSIRKPLTANVGLPPLFDELTKGIVTAAMNSAFGYVPKKRGNWKKSVDLNEVELERQARMIDLYLDRDQLSLGVGLMREWVVSWAILKSGIHSDIKDWLNHREVRGQYERRLGAIGAFAGNKAFKCIITPAQKEFGGFWNRLGDALRNFLHHHAMRIEAFEERPPFLEEVRNFWNELRQGTRELPSLGGSKGKLVISPQGTRPGVLFSALKAMHPADTCLVVCSSASVGSITDAAKHAAFGGDIEQIELTDPRGGFNEINTAVDQARRCLLEADEVVVNMTGGTTLMGIIVQRLAEEAQKLDRPVRRFVLIDRRTPDEQDKDPYVESKSQWLDN